MSNALKNQTSQVVSRPEPTRGSKYLTPKVDIRECEQEITLFAEMPGVSPDHIHLHVENSELFLMGKASPASNPGKLLLDETRHGDFYRVFSVHESLDCSKISADYKHGVLIVHLPKAEAAKPRQIKVQIS